LLLLLLANRFCLQDRSIGALAKKVRNLLTRVVQQYRKSQQAIRAAALAAAAAAPSTSSEPICID